MMNPKFARLVAIFLAIIMVVTTLTMAIVYLT